MLRCLAALALFILAALPARADDLCRAAVNATEITIDRTGLGAGAARVGRTERLLRWPSLGLDRIAGRPPACDSATLIAFLSREVPNADLDGYCLLPDDTLGYLLVPGPRNFRGRCTRTTCDRVSTAVSGARALAGTATDIATGRDPGQSRATAVIHASGAAILSGSAAQVLSSLGAGIGSAATAALAAPAVAGAAAVSVVAVGGAVYLCR